jgi:hypothetical protein
MTSAGPLETTGPEVAHSSMMSMGNYEATQVWTSVSPCCLHAPPAEGEPMPASCQGAASAYAGNGQQLEIVLAFEYLGLNFHAQHGLQATFGVLKQKIFACWALLKRQYGRLQCFLSAGPHAQAAHLCGSINSMLEL